jgi:hypothetical protein
MDIIESGTTHWNMLINIGTYFWPFCQVIWMANQSLRNVGQEVCSQKKRWSCSNLDFGYVESWAINYPTIVEDEIYKNNSNQNYTISTWNIKEFLMVLVQMLTPLT